MAPVEKTAALCKQTALLVKQSVQEIAKLHERNLRSRLYIEGARTYIETACGLPVSPTPNGPISTASSAARSPLLPALSRI
jgi:hypothetical protein